MEIFRRADGPGPIRGRPDHETLDEARVARQRYRREEHVSKRALRHQHALNAHTKNEFGRTTPWEELPILKSSRCRI
jgi:hypothetical protein